MDLSVFFDVPSQELRDLAGRLRGDQLGSRTGMSHPGLSNWQGADLVLMGMPGQPSAADAVRMALYPLSLPNEDLSIADLGNLKQKQDPEALYDALAYVMEILVQQGKTLLLVGEDPAQTLGQYFAYERLEREVQYVHIGSRLALRPAGETADRLSYNQRIFLHEPNYLKDFVHLGYQRYFVTQEELATLRDLNFAAVRYGELLNQTDEAEPYLREADMACFDLSAIRASEFGAGSFPSPGGFSAMEACQLGRYAGMSSPLSSFHLTGFVPERDGNGQGALLASLILWYFIEGFYLRRPDQNPPDKSGMRRYEIALHGTVNEIIFYQSPSTGRWWMDVPDPESLGHARSKSRLVPCSEKDYQIAREDHIPERWWREFQKREGRGE